MTQKPTIRWRTLCLLFFAIVPFGVIAQEKEMRYDKSGRSRIQSELEIAKNIFWLGEEIVGAIRVTNLSDRDVLLPDLADHRDGMFQLTQIFKDRPNFHSQTDSYLENSAKPEAEKKYAGLAPRSTKLLPLQSPSLAAVVAPTYPGEFIVTHSFFGVLARITVSAPKIDALVEAEIPGLRSSHDGPIISKNYQRVFALHDDNLTAICYKTSISSKNLKERMCQ
jgi:hypothetical protein